MLTAETKRHIDAARQVLVGVVPNPASQIDQITNALIYKFMDDMDQASVRAGGQSSFFVDDLERYGWTRLMDTRIGNQERMNLYSEALVKFSESKQLPQLFRDIFKSAFLPYRSPEVLGLFLKEINYFDYSHSEELGNAYEYLLSIMSSQGDAGQFRTPRHIIDFIVDVVNPTKSDKVLDPACGTAGFLVSAYNHILSQHDGKNSDGTKNDEKPLTPDERRTLANNFEGYDIDPGMVRISQVNMYLHQFKNPKIVSYNSLSDEDRWSDKFDVILANPPFMSPKGGVSTHSKFSVQSNRAEVLFVDYIMNHLRPNGRAGIIVPEGIIFQTGTAYKQLRKNLVEDGLYAVVSLPPGVFMPYSGVKTSILLFDRAITEKSKDILFFKVANDGYDLNAQRKENLRFPSDLKWIRDALVGKAHPNIRDCILSGNDPRTLEWFTAYNKNGKFLIVKKEDVSKTGNYNLSLDRYRDNVGQVSAKWPMVELGNICEISPKKSEISHLQKNIEVSFVPMADLSEKEMDFHAKQVKELSEVFNGYTYFSDGDVLLAKVTPCFENGKSGIAKNLKNGIGFGSSEFIVLRASEKVLPEFIYHLISTQKFINGGKSQMTGTGGLQRIPLDYVRRYSVPLPPIEIQKQIIDELGGYQQIISGARQIVQNWQPKIKINPQWEVVKIKEICDGLQYGSSKKSSTEGETVCLRMGNIQNGEIDWSDLKYATPDEEFEKYLLQDKDVLFNRTNSPDLVGKTAIYRGDRPAIFAGYLIRLRYQKEKILGEYLNYCLNSESAKEFCQRMKTDGVSQSNINAQSLGEFEIPLPSLDEQYQIVKIVEQERALVLSTKSLIDINLLKIEATLEDIWES